MWSLYLRSIREAILSREKRVIRAASGAERRVSSEHFGGGCLKLYKVMKHFHSLIGRRARLFLPLSSRIRR